MGTNRSIRPLSSARHKEQIPFHGRGSRSGNGTVLLESEVLRPQLRAISQQRPFPSPATNGTITKPIHLCDEQSRSSYGPYWPCAERETTSSGVLGHNF